MNEPQNSGITVNDALSGILTNNPELIDRLQKATKEIKDSSNKFGKAVQAVNEQYAQETAEGTQKKKLLLEQGTYLRDNRKLDEKDDLSRALASYIPDNSTPNLNALYYLMRDGNYNTELKVLRAPEDVNKNVDVLRQELENEFGTAFDHYEASQTSSPDFIKSSNKNAAKDFESFLYQSGNYDTFVKLKKLKSLTRSSVDAEAKLARKKCMELCLKYDLDYDRIPAFNEKV